MAHFKKVGLGPIADFQVIYEECLQVVIVAIKFMSLIFYFFFFLHILPPDVLNIVFGFFLVRKPREIIK